MLRAAGKFTIVYDLMKKELLKSNYIQTGESMLKVIDYKGRESKSKKYIWLYKTGVNDNSIILYKYQQTRSNSYPKAFLEDYSGYLQTAGYARYNKFKNPKRIYCLALMLRKYYDIVSNLDKECLNKSREIIVFSYYKKIYSV